MKKLFISLLMISGFSSAANAGDVTKVVSPTGKVTYHGSAVDKEILKQTGVIKNDENTQNKPAATDNVDRRTPLQRAREMAKEDRKTPRQRAQELSQGRPSLTPTQYKNYVISRGAAQKIVSQTKANTVAGAPVTAASSAAAQPAQAKPVATVETSQAVTEQPINEPAQAAQNVQGSSSQEYPASYVHEEEPVTNPQVNQLPVGDPQQTTNSAKAGPQGKGRPGEVIKVTPAEGEEYE